MNKQFALYLDLCLKKKLKNVCLAQKLPFPGVLDETI